MMKRTTCFCGAALLLVVAGCVSKPLRVDGLEFVNETGMPVTNVKLRIMKTYETAACPYIADGAMFSTPFPLEEYRRNKVEVSWSSRSGDYLFGPEAIATLKPVPEKQLLAVVVFRPAGRAEVHFRRQ